MVQTFNDNKPLNMVLTLLVMLGLGVLMLVDIDALVSITCTLLTMFHVSRLDATLIGTTEMLVLSLAALIFIVVSFEYNLKHIGTAKSCKLMTITLAVQIVIALLGVLAK